MQWLVNGTYADELNPMLILKKYLKFPKPGFIRIPIGRNIFGFSLTLYGVIPRDLNYGFF